MIEGRGQRHSNYPALRKGLPVLFDTSRTSPRRLGLTGGTAVRESQLRSILRTEAVLPLPGPVARAEVRDRCACLKVSELPGPARERAQPDEFHTIESAMAEGLVVARTREIEDDIAVQHGGVGRLRIDDPRADLDRLDVRRRDPAERSRLARVFSAVFRDVKVSASRAPLTRRPPVLRHPECRAWSASNQPQPHSRLDSSEPRVRRRTRPRPMLLRTHTQKPRPS